MDHNKISDFLVSQDCDWIQWEKNPPISSHMGGGGGGRLGMPNQVGAKCLIVSPKDSCWKVE